MKKRPGLVFIAHDLEAMDLWISQRVEQVPVWLEAWDTIEWVENDEGTAR